MLHESTSPIIFRCVRCFAQFSRVELYCVGSAASPSHGVPGTLISINLTQYRGRAAYSIGCADTQDRKKKVTWRVLCRTDQVQCGVTEARCDAKTNP